MDTKKSIVTAVLVTLIGAILLAIGASTLQSAIAQREEAELMFDDLYAIEDLLDRQIADQEATYDNYMTLFQAKADSAALFIRTSTDFPYTDEAMTELARVFNVEQLLILENDGTVVASNVGDPTEAGIETVLAAAGIRTGNPRLLADAFYNPTMSITYASIDDERMLVVGTGFTNLFATLEASAPTDVIMGKVVIGHNGFVIGYVPGNGGILYRTDNMEDFGSVYDFGFTSDAVEDGYSGFQTFGGIRYFVATSEYDGFTISCLIPATELRASSTCTTVFAVLTYLFIVTLFILYTVFFRKDQRDKALANGGARDAEKSGASADLAGGTALDGTVAKKIIPTTVIALILVFLILFFLQMLFSMSTISTTNRSHLSALADKVAAAEEETERLRDEAQDYDDCKCDIAAYIVSHLEPAQLTRSFMIELSEALGVSSIWYFDTDGNTVASDSQFWGYRLSDDPERSSYKLYEILDGYTMRAIDTPSGSSEILTAAQYTARVVQDDNLRTIGVVEIGSSYEELDAMLEQFSIEYVLDGSRIIDDGYIEVVDKSTLTLAYHPDWLQRGDEVSQHGIDPALLKVENAIVHIDGVKHFINVFETADRYYVAATSTSSIVRSTLPVSVLATLVSLVFICIVLTTLFPIRRRTDDARCIASFDATADAAADAVLLQDQPDNGTDAGTDKSDKPEGSDSSSKPDNSSKSGKSNSSDSSRKPKRPGRRFGGFIDVIMPDGRIGKNTPASSRWSMVGVRWDNKTPGQKTASCARILLVVFILCLLLVPFVTMDGQSLSNMVEFIMNGNWPRSPNMFAITNCLIIGLFAWVITAPIQALIAILARSLDARGETVCRLVSNFIKFGVALFMFYYCLATFGTDPSVLLTSTGILTLIIGLGANSLITDILAGLFIVFEGDFHVGDIVTINGFRGTIQEIGIRTTKVKNGEGNVMLFSNRNVSNILNMTRDVSTVFIEVGIDYGESIEYVESVLARELPKVPTRLPKIVDGPFYRGVKRLDDSSVVILLSATCAEADLPQLTRDLNREIKLIFDRNDINIPFPQIVLNNPSDGHEATRHQVRKANEFVAEQKELSKNAHESYR